MYCVAELKKVVVAVLRRELSSFSRYWVLSKIVMLPGRGASVCVL